nr:MAG TPA: hypothetical protein [Caudoviricetes sp.]
MLLFKLFFTNHSLRWFVDYLLFYNRLQILIKEQLIHISN